MPNVMVALPNIGGALCSTPQSLADAHYTWLPCSNAAKTRKPLKLAGVPQTTGPISAATRPKFTILSGHVEEILLFNKFFFRLSIYVPSLRRYSPIQLCDGAQKAIFGDFLGSAFPVNRAQHISDLHLKFALRAKATPCVEVWQTSNLRRLRLGEKKRRNHRAKI